MALLLAALLGSNGAELSTKVHYTGYLDQRSRLEYAGPQSESVLAQLPPGPLALCVVGGGQDGHALAEAFVEAELPPGMSGAVVTGPYMAADVRQRLRRAAERRERRLVLDFVPEPAPLIKRADRVIAMGGYNTVCEVLSFEKHALIVPRVKPEVEQWIRAQRMRDLGLLDVLHPDELTPARLTAWLAQDLGLPPAAHSRVDFGGLVAVPQLLAELLGVPVSPIPGTVRAVRAAVSAR